MSFWVWRSTAHEGEFASHEGHHHDLQSVGLLAGGGLVLHSALDGLGIGLAFQAGHGIGIAVAIAVIAHDFADGFNTFTITSLYGNTRKRALILLARHASRLTLMFTVRGSCGWSSA